MAKPTESGMTEKTITYTDYFETPDSEIDEHFKPDVDEWVERMDSDEHAAVNTYTGNKYKAMNKYLREGKYGTGENPELEKLIETCERGISKFLLKENVKVWRKSTADLLNKLGIPYNSNPEEYAKAISRCVGSVIQDKGFGSTSAKTTKWFGQVHYEIRLPKGSNAAYVNPISQNDRELEVIVNRGAEYRIVGARTQTVKGTLVPVVELELIKK